MNTAAKAPKSPAKNNATLSFMVQGWLWRYWMLTLSLAFPFHTVCMWQADTQTVTAAQQCTQYVMSQVANACLLKPPCSPAFCLRYGRTDWTTWLFWRLLGSVTSQPPGLFLGVWLWLHLSTGGLSVCSSWRVWRETLSAEINPTGNWTPSVGPGMSGPGDQKGRRAGKSPYHTYTHTHTYLLQQELPLKQLQNIRFTRKKSLFSETIVTCLYMTRKRSHKHQVRCGYSGCAGKKRHKTWLKLSFFDYFTVGMMTMWAFISTNWTYLAVELHVDAVIFTQRCDPPQFQGLHLCMSVTRSKINRYYFLALTLPSQLRRYRKIGEGF